LPSPSRGEGLNYLPSIEGRVMHVALLMTVLERYTKVSKNKFFNNICIILNAFLELTVSTV